MFDWNTIKAALEILRQDVVTGILNSGTHEGLATLFAFVVELLFYPIVIGLLLAILVLAISIIFGPFNWLRSKIKKSGTALAPYQPMRYISLGLLLLIFIYVVMGQLGFDFSKNLPKSNDLVRKSTTAISRIDVSSINLSGLGIDMKATEQLEPIPAYISSRQEQTSTITSAVFTEPNPDTGLPKYREVVISRSGEISATMAYLDRPLVHSYLAKLVQIDESGKLICQADAVNGANQIVSLWGYSHLDPTFESIVLLNTLLQQCLERNDLYLAENGGLPPASILHTINPEQDYNRLLALYWQRWQKLDALERGLIQSIASKDSSAKRSELDKVQRDIIALENQVNELKRQSELLNGKNPKLIFDTDSLASLASEFMAQPKPHALALNKNQENSGEVAGIEAAKEELQMTRYFIAGIVILLLAIFISIGTLMYVRSRRQRTH